MFGRSWFSIWSTEGYSTTVRALFLIRLSINLVCSSVMTCPSFHPSTRFSTFTVISAMR